MPIAAVPQYLGNDFSSASPALRFGMFLKLWDERQFKDENKRCALDAATPLNETDRKSIAAYVQRQQAIFDATVGTYGLNLIAESVAPFTTGLGNEHPLENGFAFLNPYGLPYLSGSGVKGVVRRAAEELAHPDFFQDGNGWTLPTIWRLFGFEPGPAKTNTEWERWVDRFSVSNEEVGSYLDAVLDDAPGTLRLKDRVLQADNRKYKLLQERHLHVRGALEFWDVVPQIKGKKLAVEIMTPHHSHYYQGKAHAGSLSPHDSGKPNPISFLTVPPGSSFVFHVRCDHPRLSRFAPELAKDGQWRTLLEAAFKHAFEWLGFGAKTAVGYGALVRELRALAQSCPWVDETIEELMDQNTASEDDTLRGRRLAQRWAKIEDPDVKQAALEEIRRRWKAEGWWDDPPGRAKKARDIYMQHRSAMNSGELP